MLPVLPVPVLLPVPLLLLTLIAANAPAIQVPGAASPTVTAGCAHADAEPRVTPAAMLPSARLTLARCVRRDLDEGRWREADARLATARRAGALLRDVDRLAWWALVVRLEATRQVDTGQWPTVMGMVLPNEDVLPWVGPLVRGVAAARASWAQQDAALQARARTELVRLDALARQAGPLSAEEHARLLVQGAMAGAQYERDEMQLLLDAAHDLELRLMSGDQLQSPVVLAWELEADLLRLTDRYAAASERYRDLLVEWPRRVQSRIALSEAYRRLGFVREADETLAQARALWVDADPEARLLLRP